MAEEDDDDDGCVVVMEDDSKVMKQLSRRSNRGLGIGRPVAAVICIVDVRKPSASSSISPKARLDVAILRASRSSTWLITVQYE